MFRNPVYVNLIEWKRLVKIANMQHQLLILLSYFHEEIFQEETAMFQTLVSYGPGNQIFTYQIYIFFPWISWITRIVLIWCFFFHSFLNCMCSILLFFKFGNIWKNQPPGVFYKKALLNIFQNGQVNTCGRSGWLWRCILYLQFK